MGAKRPGTSKGRAIRSTLSRLGMQARAEEVVAALASREIVVSRGMVQRVRFELLKEATQVRGHRATTSAEGYRPPLQRRPKFPPRRGQ